MFDAQKLAASVQQNCHISDAQFAGNYTRAFPFRSLCPKRSLVSGSRHARKNGTDSNLKVLPR